MSHVVKTFLRKYDIELSANFEEFFNLNQIEPSHPFFSKAMNMDWGCPDWTQRSQYSESDIDFLDWEWRWQFVRRSPEYRWYWGVIFIWSRNFLELVDQAHLDDIGLSKKQELESVIEKVSSACKGIFYLNSLPDPREEELDRNPFEHHGILWSNPSGTRTLDVQKLNKDGSSGPEKELIEIAQESSRESLRVAIENLGDLADADDLPKKAIAVFDFARPLLPQINAVSERLKELDNLLAKPTRAPRLGGIDRHKWSLYLRLIDADDQNAKAMEIFKQLESEGGHAIEEAANEASKIADMIKAARKLQRKGSFFL